MQLIIVDSWQTHLICNAVHLLVRLPFFVGSLMSTNLFITGGVKSGKSRLGLRCLEALTDQPLLLATARRTDDEMSARIDRHIADRPGHWSSIESPIELPAALLEHQQPLLVD